MESMFRKDKSKIRIIDRHWYVIDDWKGIRGGMCQSTHWYAKDANNLYGWEISQKLPVNGFKWEDGLSRFNEEFIKNYNENSDEGYFLEVDIKQWKQLWSSHKDLPFLPERRKLEKVEKLVCSIEEKEKYVIHIRALKQALNNGLKLKMVHRVITFQQKAWLKSYIHVNTELRKKQKKKKKMWKRFL